MGNSNNRPTWISDEIKQLPGLISGTFRQFFDNLVQGETTNIPFIFTDKPFATYELMIDGITSPVAFVDGGENLFYIVDQIGYVYIYDINLANNSNFVKIEKGIGTIYDSIVQRPLIDLSKIITPLNVIYDERGLLDMKFHPSKKDTFYIYYTIPPTTQNANYNCEAVLEEWVLEHEENAYANRIIFKWSHPDSNHFGSPIGFGDDGLLYFATGDGGGAGDKHGPVGNAQNINSPWGKIITIDVDSQNPIINIYALGFRNPWRGSFTFDGSIVVGEVGQDKYEGVHIVKRNENHGWRAFENGHVYDQNLVDKIGNVTQPVFWYGRPFGRAIIGGYQLNEKGDYIFGDFTGGKYGDNIYVINNKNLVIQPNSEGRIRFLNSLSQDYDGNLYGLFKTNMGPSGNGAIYKIHLHDI